MFLKNKASIIFLVIIFFTLPGLTNANSVSLGQKQDFFVDSNYDLSEREKITASLQRIGQKAYFYIDEQWMQELNSEEKEIVKKGLQDLDTEFSQNIYSKLIKTFGSEWSPGIDKDKQITILMHPMKNQAGGYFNDGDERLTIENPRSNQREMIYFNANLVASPIAKSFLAHEFTHLITFNQKNRLFDVEEEIWLNEARAEYAPSLVGYDNKYEGSNLEQRVKLFLTDPSDSIIEWQKKEKDYGALNIFIQYLVEHYGIEILIDSLQSPNTGITSLNYALEKNGFTQDFSEIFTDWTIAVLVNDCELGAKYCYTNENLKDLRIVPLLNFLPFKGNSTLAVTNTTKNWAGNWFKFINGQGNLKIEFIGNPDNLFKVPYLAQDFVGDYLLGFLQLSNEQRGEVLISDFGEQIQSVIMIPSIQTKTSGFSSPEQEISYFWSASIIESEQEPNDFPNYLNKPVSQMSKQEILTTISEIESLLMQLKNQLSKLTGAVQEPSIPDKEPAEISCASFDVNLYYGISNKPEVMCLQELLKSQGTEIYPEALITGNFLSLTRQAVIRFQEKYSNEILTPLGLTNGTGYVGPKTREKLNALLSK